MVTARSFPRSSPDFWRHSDRLHKAYRRLAPVESGLFDYNRLENREGEEPAGLDGIGSWERLD